MSCPGSSFYARPTQVVAKDLIGKKLVRTVNGKRLAGVIVETEAYGHMDDLASHACRGPTARNLVMFDEVGLAYVYFTYGNHFCVNVSARSKKTLAGAVLIRGIEPVEGVDEMRRFRDMDDLLSLTSGPGKLTQALNITLALNGTDMKDAKSELHIEFGAEPESVLATQRIGITRATDKDWRFIDPASPFVSRRAQGIMTRR